MALLDNKGKLANTLVYDRLSGKCREAVAFNAEARVRYPKEVVDNVDVFEWQITWITKVTWRSFSFSRLGSCLH